MSLKIIRRVALNLLTRRDYCQQELSRKLQQKGHSTEDIASEIANLVAAGFIDDHRYAENYIHARRNKGYGPKRIALELKSRGLSAEIIAQHLNITDNVWLDALSKICRKRFKSKQPKDYAEKIKQMRYLQYRGFTEEQIASVVDK